MVVFFPEAIVVRQRNGFNFNYLRAFIWFNNLIF